MKITPEGISLIRRFESLALSAYTCPGGKLTIGYGHTGSDVTPGMTIDVTKAEAFLAMDLGRFDNSIFQICPEATPAQHSAMVCLAFNIGVEKFRTSSVARLHNAGDVVGAAHAFSLWNKATGVDGIKRELRGLTRRRAAEAALYLSDDGQADEQRTRAVDVVPEKSLGRSRTVVGASIGGGATVASQAATILSELEWFKDQFYQLMPYLPAASKLLVALAVVGCGLAIYARFDDRRKGRT